MSERICAFCGASFIGQNNRRFCFSTHEIPCEDCEQFFIPNQRKLRENVRVCSPCLRVRHSIRMKELTNSGKVGFGNPENQKAAKAGVRKKYGVDNVGLVPEIRKKVKETMLERYGAESSFGSEELQKKIAKTNLERYGAENPFAAEEIKQSIKQKLLDIYGVENVTLNPEIRAKQLASMQERHGVNQPLENKTIAAAQRQTLIERYGLDNSAKLPEVREKARALRLKISDEDFSALLQALAAEASSGKISPQLLSESLSYENASPIYKRIHRLGLEDLIQYGGVSAVNHRWRLLLRDELGIDFQSEGAIFSNKRWKADLYDEVSKVAVDINPTISHSTQRAHPFYTPKKGGYHRARALDAEANGWTLYQIYDWTPKKQALSQLRNLLRLNSTRYDARKATVIKPSKESAKIFLRDNHLQKDDAVGAIVYGLEFAGELIQVMTFSKARFRGALAEYELIRLASKGTVRGGASRLLKAFERDYHPKSIQTYSSLDTGHGKVYETLGFRYHGLTALNGLYAKPETTEAYKVTTCSKKFRADYEAKNLTQQEYMNSKGFYRINDSGNKIFIWTPKERSG